MKQWFKFFKFWILICGVIIIVCAVVASGKSSSGERINNVCTETERVFDYADVLTDEQEQSLRDLIAQKEQKAECDIIIVTYNDSLEDYAHQYDQSASGSDYAMIFADNFYDENGFGWNKVNATDNGDGIILVDNWYRENDGKVYTWISTAGKCESTISYDECNEILDDVYLYVESDPYEAYKTYVEDVAKKMTASLLPTWLVIILPIIAAAIFIVVELNGKEGSRTTNAETYTGNKGGDFSVRNDRFLRKTVTERVISDDNGGGGGHTSAGGFSHGGAGHSR